MRQRIRSWITLALQPWPLAPVVTGLMLSGAAMTQFIALAVLAPPVPCRISCIDAPAWLSPAAVAHFRPTTSAQLDIVALVVNGIATGLAGTLTLAWLRRRDLPMFSRGSRGHHLLSLALASLASSTARNLVFPVVIETSALRPVLTYSLRMFVVLIAAHIVLGMSGQEYQRALRVAESAVADLHRQQRLVVEADERARRDVAAFLHDQVQARLLVAAMRLRSVSSLDQAAAEAAVQQAIEELEAIRTDDVRGAGRRLSPDIEALGLDSALDELAASWEPAMRVRIRFEGPMHRLLHAAEQPKELRVAIYRTVEQALLNAAGHGHASAVDVTFTQDASGWLLLHIADDGIGLRAGTPGSGSALIDAWMEVVGGSWQLASAANGGTIVMAMMPMWQSQTTGRASVRS